MDDSGESFDLSEDNQADLPPATVAGHLLGVLLFVALIPTVDLLITLICSEIEYDRSSPRDAFFSMAGTPVVAWWISRIIYRRKLHGIRIKSRWWKP